MKNMSIVFLLLSMAFVGCAAEPADPGSSTRCLQLRPVEIRSRLCASDETECQAITVAVRAVLVGRDGKRRLGPVFYSSEILRYWNNALGFHPCDEEDR